MRETRWKKAKVDVGKEHENRSWRTSQIAAPRRSTRLPSHPLPPAAAEYSSCALLNRLYPLQSAKEAWLARASRKPLGWGHTLPYLLHLPEKKPRYRCRCRCRISLLCCCHNPWHCCCFTWWLFCCPCHGEPPELATRQPDARI